MAPFDPVRDAASPSSSPTTATAFPASPRSSISAAQPFHQPQKESGIERKTSISSLLNHSNEGPARRRSDSIGTHPNASQSPIHVFQERSPSFNLKNLLNSDEGRNGERDRAIERSIDRERRESSSSSSGIGGGHESYSRRPSSSSSTSSHGGATLSNPSPNPFPFSPRSGPRALPMPSPSSSAMSIDVMNSAPQDTSRPSSSSGIRSHSHSHSLPQSSISHLPTDSRRVSSQSQTVSSGHVQQSALHPMNPPLAPASSPSTAASYSSHPTLSRSLSLGGGGVALSRDGYGSSHSQSPNPSSSSSHSPFYHSEHGLPSPGRVISPTNSFAQIPDSQLSNQASLSQGSSFPAPGQPFFGGSRPDSRDVEMNYSSRNSDGNAHLHQLRQSHSSQRRESQSRPGSQPHYQTSNQQHSAPSASYFPEVNPSRSSSSSPHNRPHLNLNIESQNSNFSRHHAQSPLFPPSAISAGSNASGFGNQSPFSQSQSQGPLPIPLTPGGAPPTPGGMRTQSPMSMNFVAPPMPFVGSKQGRTSPTPASNPAAKLNGDRQGESSEIQPAEEVQQEKTPKKRGRKRKDQSEESNSIAAEESAGLDGESSASAKGKSGRGRGRPRKDSEKVKEEEQEKGKEKAKEQEEEKEKEQAIGDPHREHTSPIKSDSQAQKQSSVAQASSSSKMEEEENEQSGDPTAKSIEDETVKSNETSQVDGSMNSSLDPNSSSSSSTNTSKSDSKQKADSTDTSTRDSASDSKKSKLSISTSLATASNNIKSSLLTPAPTPTPTSTTVGSKGKMKIIELDPSVTPEALNKRKSSVSGRGKGGTVKTKGKGTGKEKKTNEEANDEDTSLEKVEEKKQMSDGGKDPSDPKDSIEEESSERGKKRVKRDSLSKGSSNGRGSDSMDVDDKAKDPEAAGGSRDGGTTSLADNPAIHKPSQDSSNSIPSSNKRTSVSNHHLISKPSTPQSTQISSPSKPSAPESSTPNSSSRFNSSNSEINQRSFVGRDLQKSVPQRPNSFSNDAPLNSMMIPITFEEARKFSFTSTNPLRKEWEAIWGQRWNDAGRKGGLEDSWKSAVEANRGSKSGSGDEPRFDSEPNLNHGSAPTQPVVLDYGDDSDWNRKPNHSSNQPNGTPPMQNDQGQDQDRAVADHYNQRPEYGIQNRRESPIYPLRTFNNWAKSVLISKFVRSSEDVERVYGRPVFDGEELGEERSGYQDENMRFGYGKPRGRIRDGRILELGCGKGGDMRKWEKANVSEVIMIDIAEVSVEQARKRYQEFKQQTSKRIFDADFFAFDCFSIPLAERLPPRILERQFDNVSLQFCMHYAWESIDKARVMLDNVARYLRPGGIFLGTIPDSSELRRRLESTPSPTDLSFGNDTYKITFDQRDNWKPFGNRYHFFLVDAVDVPEFVVDWEAFRSLASEYGLHLLYKQPFGSIFDQEIQVPDYRNLLKKQIGVDSFGRPDIPLDMWEAITIYTGFAFIRR